MVKIIEHHGKHLLVTAAAVTMISLGACSSSPAYTTAPVLTTTPVPVRTTTPATAQTPGKSVTINLIAQNIAFNMNSITVPAGATVNINFDNKDSGIAHNFAVYQNLSGGQTKPVFVGNTITGPSSVTYQFIAPAGPGSYFFECDVHPTMMNGSFIVQ